MISYKYLILKQNRWENLIVTDDIWSTCLRLFSSTTNIRVFSNGKLIATVRFSPNEEMETF